jgi:hypothetical protein
MKKETQILLGVGALAVVGYLVMKNNQQPKKANASGIFANETSLPTKKLGRGFACDIGSKQSIVTAKDGTRFFRCINPRGLVSFYDGDGNQVSGGGYK